MKVNIPWLYKSGFKRLLTPLPYVMFSSDNLFVEFDRKRMSWRATKKDSGDCIYVENREELERMMK